MTVKKSSEVQQVQSAAHPLRKVRIAKLTLNIGVGKSEEQLKRGLKLLEKLSGQKPIATLSKKRIPAWGLRPGLAIGCKVTVRKSPEDLLRRILMAKEMKLSQRNFDQSGNFSFGIPEYIDIAGMEYDPELKIMGLEVAVTLERPGYRIKHRKVKNSAVGKKHVVSQAEAIAFAQKLGVEVQ